MSSRQEPLLNEVASEASEQSERGNDDEGHTTPMSILSRNPSTQYSSLPPRPISPARLETSPPKDGECSAAGFHLPPKPLERRSTRRRKLALCAQILLILIILGGGSYLSREIIYWGDLAGRGAHDMDGDCENASASGIQGSFVVDTYIVRNLTFARAKILDLAWDTVIGQGMKFVHAWILYHVASRCLTAAMEKDAIPHSTHLSVQFSTVSLSSLWSSLSLLSAKRPLRVLCLGLWLSFGIAYVLTFAMIWSATTGYISGSSPTYTIAGSQFVSLRSSEFTLCWVLDDARVTHSGEQRVIKGPQAIEALTIHHDKPGQIWIEAEKLKALETPIGNDMDEFMDIWSYFVTKATLLALLHPVAMYGFKTTQDLDLENINEMQNDVFNSSRINMFGDGQTLFDGFWASLTSISNIGGWQMEHAPRIAPEQRVNFGFLNSTTNVSAKKARFFRSNTTATNTTNHLRYSSAISNLPYNSTIWLGGEQIQLPAPFLDASQPCSSWLRDNDMGFCLCINGNPVNERFDNVHFSGCISDTGYSWGFASQILGVALAFELVWIATTWMMWTWANQRSALVSMHRPGTGTLRNILDTAEAITAHIGDQHSAYTEKELAKQMERSPPLRYVVESRRDVEHIGLRPIMSSAKGEKGMRRRIQVDADTVYG
ncbi:uncharacterized protein PG998_012816 [Apiospora kogelbergensis]|uniref:uncharacterized protein n=1 Tax=Apiospora kogelbergensis TaxID=1337665 RepID=UPI0031310E48